MVTTIYLIRHSIKFSYDDIEERKTSQSPLLIDEKRILSVEGEERAKKLADLEELQNIDKVYVSNCVRTLQTAKYLLNKQKLKVTIDERFDERRTGKPNDEQFPDWYERQYFDENFKTIGGESQRDVRNRMEEAIGEILAENKGKRIAIFSHGHAISMYLRKWADLKDIKRGYNYSYKFEFKGKVVIDGELDMPSIYKLEFDDNSELTNLEYLKIKFI